MSDQPTVLLAPLCRHRLACPTRAAAGPLRRLRATAGQRVASLCRRVLGWPASDSARSTGRRTGGWRWVLAGAVLVAPLVPAQPIEVAPGHLRVAVPGRPFGMAFGSDGRTLYVVLDAAMPRGDASLAVYAVADGVPSLVRRVPLGSRAAGVAVSHDGRLLAVAQQDAGVGFYDVEALRTNREDVRLALSPTGPGPNEARGSGTIGVGFSNDDALLLATDEWQARVSVFDVRRIREPATRAAARLGAVPTGSAPVGIAFSADGHAAFVTSEVGPARALPADCSGRGGNRRPAGLVTRIDLDRLVEAPAEAVVAASSAGCEAVRIVLDDGLAYVSARGSDAVLALDPTRFADGMTSLAEAPGRAIVRRYQVGAQPVGIAVVGQRLVVADSHRASGGAGADIKVIGTVDGRVLATLPAADFPREIAVSPSGSLVVVGAYLGQALEIIDLKQVAATP